MMAGSDAISAAFRKSRTALVWELLARAATATESRTAPRTSRRSAALMPGLPIATRTLAPSMAAVRNEPNLPGGQTIVTRTELRRRARTIP
jgi:hypothetical protein